jgi:hypothetical protein
MERDPTQPRWLWLYDFETRALSFQKSCEEIPRDHHPIVIGYFLPKSEDWMVLDLRSFDRAWQAIPFFDRYIPRNVARVTRAEVVNRLFSADEFAVTPDKLFDRPQPPARDPEAVLRTIAEEVRRIGDPGERVQAAAERIEAESKCPSPEIEQFPIHFYEEGIQNFETALKLRQIIAHQHWLGNTSYSMYDIIQEMMGRTEPDASVPERKRKAK